MFSGREKYKQSERSSSLRKLNLAVNKHRNTNQTLVILAIFFVCQLDRQAIIHRK